MRISKMLYLDSLEVAEHIQASYSSLHALNWWAGITPPPGDGKLTCAFHISTSKLLFFFIFKIRIYHWTSD